VAELSIARVCCRSLPENGGSNPCADINVYFECHVWSGRDICEGPIRSPEKSYRLRCVIVCDLDTSKMRRPWPALGCCAV
jgi:hypothetical protein